MSYLIEVQRRQKKKPILPEDMVKGNTKEIVLNPSNLKPFALALKKAQEGKDGK